MRKNSLMFEEKKGCPYNQAGVYCNNKQNKNRGFKKRALCKKKDCPIKLLKIENGILAK